MGKFSGLRPAGLCSVGYSRMSHKIKDLDEAVEKNERSQWMAQATIADLLGTMTRSTVSPPQTALTFVPSPLGLPVAHRGDCSTGLHSRPKNDPNGPRYAMNATKNKFEHHDDAKSLLQATELKDGADATLDDLDNDTAIHLIRFTGCGHLNVVMLEKPAETSPGRWSTKCGCKFPLSNGNALEFLADNMVESWEKCPFCHRSNLRREHFSRSARLVEARDIPRWQDEVSGPD